MSLYIPAHRTRCAGCGELAYCAPLETTPTAGISIDEDPGRDNVPTPMLCTEGPEACMGYWNLLEALAASPLADITAGMIGDARSGPFARVRELFFERD